MIIRDYHEKDFERLCEIHDLARMNELKASNLEVAFVPLEVAAIDEDLFQYIIQVAELNGDVVGFVAFLNNELAWLYVDLKHNKQGIGKALVEYVKDYYLGEEIVLEVISGNTPAISFYEKMGFGFVKKESGAMPGNETFIIEVDEMRYKNRVEKLTLFTEKDKVEIIEVWESSVLATHHFLSKSDIETLKPQVLEGAEAVDNFFVVREDSCIIAFLGVHNDKIEMLFVDDQARGKGIGKLLINFALDKLKARYVDVNEDNDLGLGFYVHMGFKQIGRSESDEAGNPFPIIHMSLSDKQ